MKPPLLLLALLLNLSTMHTMNLTSATLEAAAIRDSEEETKEDENSLYNDENKLYLKHYLYDCCRCGMFGSADSLLRQNLSQDIINDVFVYIHHIDIPEFQLAAIQLLLRYGADPNTVKDDGNNLLQALLYTDNPLTRNLDNTNNTLYPENPDADEIIKKLISAGLNIEHKNNNGFTALDLAANYGTEKAQRLTQNNIIPHRTIHKYHHIAHIIAHTLDHIQTTRQHIHEALDNQFPDTLKNLLYEYTNVADGKKETDRKKEINFVKEHQPLIKWRLKYDYARFHAQQITDRVYDTLPLLLLPPMLTYCLLLGSRDIIPLPTKVIRATKDNLCAYLTVIASTSLAWDALKKYNHLNIATAALSGGASYLIWKKLLNKAL